MPILLSDEEIIAGVNDGGYAEGGELVSLSEAGKKEYQGVCRAQLKNVVEWLNKDCTEHPKTSDSYNKTYYLARSDCPECMEALKKEAGLT